MTGACGYKHPPDPPSRQATLEMVFEATSMSVTTRYLPLHLDDTEVWNLQEPLGLTIAIPFLVTG